METTPIRISTETRRLLGLVLRWGNRSTVGSIGTLVGALAADAAGRILATQHEKLSEATYDTIAGAIAKVDAASRGRVTRERIA